MVSDAIRERYLRDPLPIRLGGLAADLARVASFAENPKNHDAVSTLLEEGKYFAEWAAPGAPLETQAALAEIQVLMALWHLRWQAGRPDPDMRQQAKEWSDRLLALAGLV
jgi:hypothetical protein